MRINRFDNFDVGSCSLGLHVFLIREYFLSARFLRPRKGDKLIFLQPHYLFCLICIDFVQRSAICISLVRLCSAYQYLSELGNMNTNLNILAKKVIRMLQYRNHEKSTSFSSGLKNYSHKIESMYPTNQHCNSEFVCI